MYEAITSSKMLSPLTTKLLLDEVRTCSNSVCDNCLTSSESESEPENVDDSPSLLSSANPSDFLLWISDSRYSLVTKACRSFCASNCSPILAWKADISAS